MTEEFLGISKTISSRPKRCGKQRLEKPGRRQCAKLHKW